MSDGDLPEVSALAVTLETPEGDLIEVGYLYNAIERNWFEFAPDYWDLPWRPVLGQVFEEHGRAWRPSSFVALPHWFSHLLPEGRLRDAVAAAAGANPAREFNLLSRIGVDDLPGALRIGPPDGLAAARVPPELVIASADEPDENPLLKFSLAGTQLKFSIFRSARGLTVPLKGQAGNVIAKLPDTRPGYVGFPELELASLRLAELAGIETPNSSLVSLSEIAGLEEWADEISSPALIVERFDRRGDGRVHMEELAQVLNIPTAVENAKYRRANFETVANLIAGLCGVESVEQVIRRIVFNVLIGNGDAHLKNWAIIYDDGVNPSLSPVYDVLPTALYISDDDLGMKLANSRSFEDVSLKSFDSIGLRTSLGVPEARAFAKDAVERVMTHWDTLRDAIPSQQFDRLSDRLTTLRLTGKG